MIKLKNPKKVLIFSLSYYPNFIGGAEVAIKEITDRISPKEIEFDLITIRKDEPKFERIGNVNVYRVGTFFPKSFGKLHKYIFIFSAFFKAVNLQRKNHYDAFWAMMANYAGFSALFFKTFYPKIPFLLTLQEGDSIDYIKNRVRFVYPIFKKIFTKADFIQTISNYLSDFARSMGYRGRIEVVPNGVDIKNFFRSFDTRELENLKEKFGKKPEDIFLISASRMVKKNALGDIIRALPTLSSNIKLLIVGIGEEENELKKLSKILAVEERVFFAGFISHKELPKYLKISDIFIRPSLSEGFGNSFIEAMAVGIPVIATPVGGIVDFLKDKETGIFCEVSDPDDIARKVLILVKDREINSYIVENAKKMVLGKYDWSFVVSSMREKVFDKILNLS